MTTPIKLPERLVVDRNGFWINTEQGVAFANTLSESDNALEKKIYAKELARRWNCHAEFIRMFREVNENAVGLAGVRRIGRAALALAKKEQP
jgi:hypothetical protein